ncbi:hypothetical protein VP1G_11318 [Cytospora mali]|uniref:Uncharacterized protein n=1 Tax=Cytospora mali TaxID=578113 RepID=A0A194VE17_CYTMA|nr:hypothetical protein VP1G_11318 [Valsa mali var. pyri (nom. inval.)]
MREVHTAAAAAAAASRYISPTQGKAQIVEEHVDIVQVSSSQPGCLVLRLLGLLLLDMSGRDDEDIVGAHVWLRGVGTGVNAYLAPVVVV